MLVSLKSMKGMTAAMLALLLAATLVAHETSGAPLPGYNAALPGQSLPLLEISRPRNGARLAGADVQVAIVLRPELVRGGLRDPRVCLSMQAVAGAARDVEVDPPGELPETCFRGSLNYTSFDLGGLVPGLSYGVTVGLESRGRVVAISSRTFSVAAVRLPGVERPVGIAEALDAGALLQQERPPRAEAAAKIYYDVLDQFPSLERAHHLLGVALLQLQDPDGGLAHLFQAVQLNDSDANFHHSLATALQAAKRSKEAIQHFERALELQPTSLQSAVTLGDVLHITGNWTGALAVYRRAVELGSQGDGLEGYVGVYPPEKYAKDCTSRICELLRVTEGWYPADRCLKDALNKWPGDAMFHHDRGNMLLTVGQFESALMEFQKSSSIGYTEAEVRSPYVVRIYDSG
jgi:Flp pilus assembly protein TadD